LQARSIRANFADSARTRGHRPRLQSAGDPSSNWRADNRFPAATTKVAFATSKVALTYWGLAVPGRRRKFRGQPPCARRTFPGARGIWRTSAGLLENAMRRLRRPSRRRLAVV